MRNFESDSDDDTPKARDKQTRLGASGAEQEFKVQEVKQSGTLSGDESDDDEDDAERAGKAQESPAEALARHHRNIESITSETVGHALSALRDHRIKWEQYRRIHHAHHHAKEFLAVNAEEAQRDADVLRIKAEKVREEVMHSSRAHALQQHRHKQEEDRLIDEINRLRCIANKN